METEKGGKMGEEKRGGWEWERSEGKKDGGWR